MTNLPPVTTLGASGGLNGPSSGSVSVTLGVTDQENDRFTMYVRIDGQAATVMNAFTLSTVGIHQIEYWSED